MINFSGWEMPIHYGSQMKEHLIVRKSCGLFDVSHMAIIDISGAESKELLKLILANDISNLSQEYDALYSAMLNERGGIIDDLIAYKIPMGFRLIVNCATRNTVLKWIEKQILDKKVKIHERKDLSILAIQGPSVYKVISKIFSLDFVEKLKNLRSFQGILVDGMQVSKTGYTGERGVEIIIPNELTEDFWNKVLDAGALPIGLGARDTLRLEAGLNLYGSDMDEDISPLECNMEWTVSLKNKNREFIGKEPFLNKKKRADFHVLKGLLFNERAIVRSNQEVFFNDRRIPSGVITSGSYSPSLKKSIALARIPTTNLKTCVAEVRGKRVEALIGSPQFVKEGKLIFKEN